MTSHNDSESLPHAAMGTDPLGDDDEVLARTLYSSTSGPLIPLKTDAPVPLRGTAASHPDGPTPEEKPQRAARNARAASPKRSESGHRRPTSRPQRRSDEESGPKHYKVLSISLYNDDIDHMDALVQALKEKGFTRMSRSALIRFALDQVDINKMPRGY